MIGPRGALLDQALGVIDKILKVRSSRLGAGSMSSIPPPSRMSRVAGAAAVAAAGSGSS